MEWLYHPFARPVLLVALMMLLAVWFTYRQLRPYHRLRKVLPAGMPADRQIPVGYLSQEDLAGGRVHARVAKPAMLVTDENGDIDVYVLTRWNAYLHYRMPSAETGYDWFRSTLGGILPPLLRLRFEGRSHYLYRRNRVAGNPARKAGKLYADLAGLIPNLPLPRSDGFRYMAWGIRGYALLLVGAVVVAIGASWSPGLDEAPMVLVRQDDGQVYAASLRVLYRFDAADQLVERVELPSLGISDGVADMEFLGDGRFLVGDSSAGMIKVCDFAARKCEALEGFDADGQFLRSFQFVPDSRHDRIYAVDSSRHRLLELDMTGELLREIAGPDSLCFPNSPMLAQNMLVVANTNHHKLVAWDVAQAGFAAPVREWPTVRRGRIDVNCPPVNETPNAEYFARERPHAGSSRAVPFSNSRPGRVWPMVIASVADGGLWLLNAGNNMQFADLLVFDDWPSDSRPRRVQLDAEADPIDILVRDNDVLLADTGRPSIIRLSREGRVLEDFGGEVFTGQMALIRDRQQMYEQVARYAIYLVLLLLLLLAIGVSVAKVLRVKYIIMEDPSFTTIREGRST